MTLRNTSVACFAGLTGALLSVPFPVIGAEETPQAPVEESPQPPPTPAQSGTTVTAGSFESGTLLQLLDRAFDAESDSFDPEDGTMQWKGRTFNVGNNRLFKARFSRYLDTPDGDLEQELEYQEHLDEIFYKLSARNRENREENINEAWTMLFEAADFAVDSNNCLVIANMVYNAWRVRDEHRANRVSRAALEDERREAESIVANRERMLRQLIEERERIARDDKGEETPTDGVATGSEAAFRQRDLTEVEARIAALKGHNTVTAQQVKLQFQSQILSFFFQRRFQHALISTSFYRMIFKGTAQGLEVGESELNDFMPESDLVPSIETLEFLAREAIADVGAGMSAVGAAYREDRMVNALHRLQETFFLGEHLQPVKAFPYEKRRDLLQVYRQMEEARKLADLKDFGEVETLAREIAQIATDFRLSETLSAVRSVKQMSNLALFAAQQGFASGDAVRAEEGLSRAAKIWPLNPALDSFTQQLTSKVDLSSQAAEEFDKRYSQAQYRELFNRRSELMPGVLGDAERGERMREVIDNVGRIDMLLAQSREMVAQDNPFAAWEMLAAAAEIDPDDVHLNREKAKLAPSVASFVGTLDAAAEQEEEGNYGVSLSRYLAVRELYPASRLARRGIERVGESLMDQLEAAGGSPNGFEEIADTELSDTSH